MRGTADRPARAGWPVLLVICLLCLGLGGCLGAIYGSYNQPWYEQPGLEHPPR